MGERGWVVTAGVVVTLLAVSLGLPAVMHPAQQKTAAVSAAPPAKSAAPKPAPHKLEGWAVIRLLSRHLGIDVDAAPAASRDTALGKLREALRTRGAVVKVAIASVPDPIDSHLAYMFDQHVDALTRAATGLGYSLESWTFAWPRDADSAKSALHDLGAEAPHRREPGAMLFSRASDRARGTIDLLVILLVGEAPTFGVHPLALRASLDLAVRLALTDSSPLAISFVGPTYSGSARLLAESLHRWSPELCAHRALRIDFFTGSATSPSIESDLTWKDADQACLETTFRRLTHDDAVLGEKFFAYLKLRGDDERDCAEVSERGTVYGAASTDETSPEKSHATCAFRLEFPLHLSQLRNASERNESSAPYGKLDSPLARSALDLVMEDESAAVDVPQPYSPRLSANVTELELANTLASLHDRRVRYVGLTATDSRDKLFLAKILRRVAPSVHLFTLDSDALYGHPRFSGDLLGTLLVSSYPLTSSLPGPLQVWTGRRVSGTEDRPPTTFGSGATEGTYGAALAAFGVGTAPGDCTPEKCPCGWLGDAADRPPVWVSAVGRDTTWPVWVSDWPAPYRESVSERWGEIASKFVPSVFFRVVLLSLSLGAAAQGIAHLVGVGVFGRKGRERISSPTPPPAMLRWLLVPDLSTAEARPPHLTRAVYLVLSLALVAVPAAVALIPVLGQARASQLLDAARLPELAVAACLLFAIAPAAALGIWCAVPGLPGPWEARAAAAAGVAAGCFGLYLLASHVSSGDLAAQINWLLFSQRATHLESGLTPLTPIVVLGAGLMALVVILARRAQLAARFSLIDPLVAFSTGRVAKLLAPHARAIERELTPSSQLRSWTPAGVAAGVVLFALPAAAFVDQAWLPLDPGAWEWTFKLAGVTLVGGLFYSGVGFLSIWSRMRKLLRALATSNLRDAFGRLPTRMSRSVGLEPTASPAIVTELEYCVRQRRLLSELAAELVATEGAKLDEGLAKWAGRIDETGGSAHRARLAHLEAVVARDLTSAAESRRPVPAIMAGGQHVLAREVSAFVLPVLDTWWAKSESPVAPGTESLESAKLAAELKALPSGRPFDSVTLAENGFAKVNQRFWFRLAEEFVAAQVVTFLSYGFVHLRSSLRGITLGLVLLLVGASSYPFEPQVFTLNFVTMLVASAVGAALYTFTQASRNELLSLIENTTPNEVSWNANLVLQVATYVAIPVAAAVTSQLPLLGRVVSSLFSGLTVR